MGDTSWRNWEVKNGVYGSSIKKVRCEKLVAAIYRGREGASSKKF
jgi:hypothetical protein